MTCRGASTVPGIKQGVAAPNCMDLLARKAFIGEYDGSSLESRPWISLRDPLVERADREACRIQLRCHLVPRERRRYGRVRPAAHRIRRDDGLHIAVAEGVGVHASTA